MKSSHAALALIGLLLAGLWYVGGGSASPQQSATAAEQVRVSEPVAHDNLTVYFVHGSDVVENAKVATLQEALAAGWAVVHETENVNQLAVENRSSDHELFIQEGDIIKGGKQDRLIAIDMLLPPNSGRVSFPAHCVEQGRWTKRGAEATANFEVSTRFAVGNELKYANATYQQGEVWKKVALQQDKLSENVGKRVNSEESASSLQLALENPAVLARVAAYEEVLRDECARRKNVVGVVFAVNGKMTGAEVYGSSTLFQKAWPKLLNSAATEALAEKSARSHATAPSAREVERFLACGEPQAQPAGREGELPRVREGIANDVTEINGEADGRAVERNSLGMNPPARALIISGGGQRVSESEPVRMHRRVGNSTRSSGGRGDLHLPQGEQIQTEGRPVQTGGQVFQTEGRPSTPGNRLNINRVDGAAGLVTESRDPGRGNAIIHKSYIKK